MRWYTWKSRGWFWHVPGASQVLVFHSTWNHFSFGSLSFHSKTSTSSFNSDFKKLFQNVYWSIIHLQKSAQNIQTMKPPPRARSRTLQIPPQTAALLMSNPQGWFCLFLSGLLCVGLLLLKTPPVTPAHVIACCCSHRRTVPQRTDTLHYLHIRSLTDPWVLSIWHMN